MTTWSDWAGDFDNNVARQPGVTDFNTANSAAEYLGGQVTRLRGSIGAGFTKLDDLVDRLNDFGNKLDRDLGTFNVNLDSQLQTMQGKVDNLTVEADTFRVVDRAMGDLNGKVDTEMSNLKRDFEARWAVMTSTVDGLNKGISEIRNFISTNGVPSNFNGKQPRSILQDKAIANFNKLGKDKSKWKNWLVKLKNILSDTLPDDHWEFWMGIAEANMKSPSDIKDNGELADTSGVHTSHYFSVAKLLKTLLMEKIEEDTQGFLIIKRNNDGLQAYGELFRHMMELTQDGINDRMSAIMQPSRAKRDEDVMGMLEAWEDDYNDAVLRGMTTLGDPFKISIVRDRIATEKLKDRMDMQFYATYQEAREDVMKWARPKAARASETLRADRRAKTSGDIEMGGVNVIDQLEAPEDDIAGQINHLKDTVGELCAMFKGTKGAGKGPQWGNSGPYNNGKNNNYQTLGKGGQPNLTLPVGNKGFGKGGQGPLDLYPFYGVCKGCNVYGHPVSRCPTLGKGVKGKCDHCNLPGHLQRLCPIKHPKGASKGGKGNLNMVEGGDFSYEENAAEGIQHGESQSAGSLGAICLGHIRSVSIPDPPPSNFVSRPEGKKTYKDTLMKHYENCQGCQDGGCTLKPPPGIDDSDGYVTILRGGKKIAKHKQRQNTFLGELNILTKEDLANFNKQGEQVNEWVKVSGVVDSGAITTVTPPNLIPWVPITATETSKRGAYYTSADGGKVYDQGQKTYEGFTDSSQPTVVPATAANIGKTLFSVREMSGADNIVAFGLANDHAIVNMKTGKVLTQGGKDIIVNKAAGSKTNIIDTGKEYLMNIWLKKPKGNLNAVHYEQVGHGRWNRAIPTHNRFRTLGEDETFATF